MYGAQYPRFSAQFKNIAATHMPTPTPFAYFVNSAITFFLSFSVNSSAHHAIRVNRNSSKGNGGVLKMYISLFCSLQNTLRRNVLVARLFQLILRTAFRLLLWARSGSIRPRSPLPPRHGRRKCFLCPTPPSTYADAHAACAVLRFRAGGAFVANFIEK